MHPWHALNRLNHLPRCLKIGFWNEKTRSNAFRSGYGQRWRDKQFGTAHAIDPDVKHVSSSINRPTEAQNVLSIASLDNKANRSRVTSQLSHTFRIAPSLTMYCRAFTWSIHFA